MKQLIIGIIIASSAFWTYSQKELDTVRVKKKLFYMPQHAIKVDVLRFMSGDVIFSYEKAFHYNNGFEIEVGPTISMIGFNRMNFLGIARNIPNYDGQTNNLRDQGYGFLLSAAYKKYVLNGRPAMNGLYISSRLKFRNYNNYSNFSNFNPLLTKKYKDNLYQGLMTFQIGMNHTFRSNFGLEYYMFMGLTFNSFNYHYYTETYDGNTDSWTESIDRNKVSFVNPNFGFGLKLYIGM